MADTTLHFRIKQARREQQKLQTERGTNSPETLGGGGEEGSVQSITTPLPTRHLGYEASLDVQSLVPDRPIPHWIKSKKARPAASAVAAAASKRAVTGTASGASPSGPCSPGGRSLPAAPPAAAAATAAKRGMGTAKSGVSSNEVQSVVDSSNAIKAWKTPAKLAKEQLFRDRARQNKQPEPVRTFPGNIRPLRVPIDSPVADYFRNSKSGTFSRKQFAPPSTSSLQHLQSIADGCGVDLDQAGRGAGRETPVPTPTDGVGGDEEATVGGRSAVSTNSLIDDEQFLHMDQSELPLEIFDCLEYEALDLSPEEWLAHESGAMAPHYEDGQWHWRHCLVLDYSRDTERFLIEFQHNNKQKEVKRFNLLFDAECKETWKSRRETAEKAREEAKGWLRFDHYVSLQPQEEVRTIQGSTLRGIHGRVADGLPLSVPFPEQGSPLGHSLRELTKEVIRGHGRSMKVSILQYRLQHCDKARERYAYLRLPPPQPKPPTRWFGKVAIPNHRFREKRKAISNIHFSCLPEVLGAFLWLHTVWDTGGFADRHFVLGHKLQGEGEGEGGGLERPCAIADFEAAQLLCCHTLGDFLMHDWRRAFSEQLVDSIQDVYDFFQSDPRLYRSSALARLLKHLELRMSFQLRSLFYRSLEVWKALITEATETTQEEEEEWEDGVEREGSAGVTGKTSLFAATLRVIVPARSSQSDDADKQRPRVEVEPSLAAIEKACLAGIEETVRQVRSFTTLDADLMSLLHLPARPIFDIGRGDHMYLDVERELKDTVAYAKERLKGAMKGPERLAALYGEYADVMMLDIEDLVDTFAYAEPPPSDEAYFAQVQRFHDDADAIEMCTYDSEGFPLLEVNTCEAKRVLREKALQVRDALLVALVQTARRQNSEVVERYEGMLRRIAEKPANEAELAALKDYIVSCKGVVEELQQEGLAVASRLDKVGNFGFKVSHEDSMLCWKTREYPALVDKAGSEMDEALELDKVRMMDKLALEKELFDEVLERIEADARAAQSLDDYDQIDANADYVNSLQDAINDAKAKGEDFNMRERVFGFPPTEYAILNEVEASLEPFYKLWNMVSDFHASKKEWLHGPFLDLKGEEIDRDVTEWWKTSYRQSKTLEEEHPGAAEAAARLRTETTEFREHLPVIQALASPALKPRHWELLSEKIGSVIDPEDELTLQTLVDMQVGQYIDTIQEVCVAAEKEYGLEKALAAMKEEWVTVEFEVKPYKDTGTHLVAGVDDIVALLDDHVVKTQTMRGSPYIRPIEGVCKEWEHRLKYAQNLLDQWINVQRTWLYLEPIFSSEDIMRQLPTEARRFASVDQLWKKSMAETFKDPNFMAQADPEKKLDSKFSKANEKLDEIQKGLSDYLEMKRLYFPRFFFLSNDELLEILSQTKEPRAVQPHLNKAFEGIAKCKFESDLRITEMISAEGEVVKLLSAVNPESTANKGNVERWLLELESMQWESIRDQTAQSMQEYPTMPREEWMLRWPAQVVLGVSQVYWTRSVSDAIRDKGTVGLEELEVELNEQLKAITLAVRGPLSKLERRTLGALCTIDVHARDTIVSMVESRVAREDDFEWMSQLRYYWSESWKDGQAVAKGQETLVVRIVNARCLYGYEYLGNTMRLVITPLTDRCYRTMIGAIDLLYGGAPEGPAGTGKTETVKDLSKAVAIQCVVFNCSDGLDYLAMAKFFKGLAGCGSWCCFDEFNRINIEVLSVIAQQILTINKAKKALQDKFHFEGTYMKINHNANAFITMNPGYAGRAELPDNLKALFRPCAMMVPNYALIAEIRLYSFGFEDARSNAQKLVRVLQLSSEQLSSQKHYDYGMRAVNSILVAAGNLRQQLGGDPSWTEAKIVLRSVNDVNLPKFTVEDLPLFKGITSDLFPGVDLSESDHGPLLGAMDDVCHEGITFAPGKVQRLEPKESWKKKVVQLYEMVLVRHGVMIVGQTGSGKTASIQTLAHAMTKCNELGGAEGEEFPKVQVHVMNPKSVSSGQLYGNFDENTHEWSDGILAVIYRNCAKDPCPDRKWLLFDGPVDAVWIENMNTVLDDNKKLCLMSGEIIKMSDSMTMMFEAEDLEQASPATVSRVGMIFCEIRNLSWQPLRNVWLDSLPDSLQLHRSLLEELFDWLFPAAVYFVHKNCAIPTKVTGQELAASLIRLFDTFLNSPGGYASDMVKVLESLFVQSLVWSVGACVDGAGREKFDAYMRAVMCASSDALSAEGGGPALSNAHADFLVKNRQWVPRDRPVGALPGAAGGGDGNTLHDFRFDPKKGQWSPWLDKTFKYVIPEKAQFHSIVVPTLDTVRNEFLIDALLCNGHHVMCTGDTGTGKSVSIKTKLLSGLEDPKYNMSIMLNFSAQTSANQTQDIIDSKLDKRRKGVLGPPLGHRCVVFVDDLNMPAKEDYGAQPPIEILRQWMDHSGWYDRKDNTYRQLVDIQFIVAMGPPGGGRTSITGRYVRHFSLINFVPFSHESLNRVFGTILDWYLQRGFSSAVKAISHAVVSATVDMYASIAKSLLPTPAKSHYTFNLRDLSKVFQGVLQASAFVVSTKEDFVRLWAHESMRVFQDRLIDDPDRDWFTGSLAAIVKEHFNLDWHTARVQGPNEQLIYGNFADPKANTRVYQEIEDQDALVKVMNDYLEDYNAMTSKPMSLVLFRNAIEHVARISRVICQPMGNALLVGVGGSGRKSLTTLAVSVADYGMFSIEISKSYGILDWRDDLKKVLSIAGVDNKPTVFMVDDTQVVDETFLEDINGILNTGEVPNLFNNDDLAAMQEAISKPAQAQGVNVGSPAEVYAFFVQRARTNLHVVLCLSPIGDAFRTRLRMFPSLTNCCTIDWFTAWPNEALESVAKHFLDTVALDEVVKAGVVDVCVDMQRRVRDMSVKYRTEMGRFYYVTPTSYLELINTFKALLNKQRSSVLDRKERYDNGLLKLAETESQVETMQTDLEALQPKLKEATISTDALLVQIAQDTEVANERKGVVEAEEVLCNKQASEAMAMKADCLSDLAEALPALENAIGALKSLSKGDIVEVKAMKKPPAAVKMVMEAVCIMMGVKPDKVKDPAGGNKKVDDYWPVAQKVLLGDSRFLQNLMDYDKDNMDPNMVDKVKAYTANPDFEPDKVKKGSVAAAGLCKWVHAMVVYNRVAQVVGPKRAALAEAEAGLAEASSQLAEKQAVLKALMDKLAELTAQLKEAEEKKASLQNQVTECGKKLKRAEQLISGLGGEKANWQLFSTQLQERYLNVTGDIMLVSGITAYMGAFTAGYRQAAIDQWSLLLAEKYIPCSEGFKVESTLGDPVKIREWVIAKLPNDSFSIDNAIMLHTSNRWPLMIDPQGQANKWVKRLEADNSLKVVKQNQANFVRTIENAIQFGSPILLENVPESIDPVLEPVLLKQVVTVGGIATIRLGDNSVEYDPNFRLYMTTKLTNPHYPPELCVKVNLLNFMATQEGLEDQMLGITVAREETELETRREQLVLEDADNRRVQKEIEDTILDLLKNSEGNILDDEVLIETLAQSKITSNNIGRKVKEAAKTQEIIARTRKGYAPVAFRASQLFFCIADLGTVDPMYQYSLEWFIQLFEASIAQAEKGSTLSERLEHLNDTFTHLLYTNVCRSLFEKDKLLFSFLLTIKIMDGDGTLDTSLLRFFLQGSSRMDLSRPNPLSLASGSKGSKAGASWLSDKMWGEVLAIGELGKMAGFDATFEKNLSAWQKVFESHDPAQLIAKLVGAKGAGAGGAGGGGGGGEGGGEGGGRRRRGGGGGEGGGEGGGAGEGAGGDGGEGGGEGTAQGSAGEKDEAGGFDMFQQLCLLRAIRPDMVMPAVMKFVGAQMGTRFIEPPPFDLMSCFKDSNCSTPLIFVLTPGADPMAELLRVAEKLGYGGKKLTSISLGQGQGPLAERAIGTAADQGTWVCLQNCHLCISWMPTLERICEELSPERVNDGFRLWLTSEPSPHFPTFILQNGVKMTNEPPKGMRANLLGSFYNIEQEWFETCLRPKDFKKLLFGLMFFHATVRERRKFGPLGWNIQYVFSGPDLRISMDQLRIFLDNLREDDPIPYAALAYLAGECNYGGRVTDDKDRRTLVNILSDFYCADMEDDGYKFSPSGRYYAPPEGILSEQVEYVKSLPYNEGPEVFGLHDNANISCAIAETNTLLGTALSLQPRSAGAAGKSWDETLGELVEDCTSRLPPQFDIERALLDFPVRYEESMNTVLTQELIRFNTLTEVIKETLVEVGKAIKGLVVMSAELEEVGNSMVLGKVPGMWAASAYPSLKPLGSWVTDLLERLGFLGGWMDRGEAPPNFWISGFFFTQAFITGTLQNFARKHKVPIDKADFDFRVCTPADQERAQHTRADDGAYLRGLFMEGARWSVDQHAVDESRPRELFVGMPYIHLLPARKEDIEGVEGSAALYTGVAGGTSHQYMCPVYKTSVRQGTLSTTGHSTNFVMFINLPMRKEHEQKHWIKRGVAMLTQLDD